MLRGKMQDWPLRLSTILDHAAHVHGYREVVTRTIEGPIHRSTYAELAKRARQCASALRRMGARTSDRVGTLAWNTHRHLELWYGAAGAGAIYHTVNPRLFEEQVAFIIGDADDRFLFADLTFVPLLEKLRDRCLAGRKLIVLTDPVHMPNSALDLLCYEELIAGEPTDYPWEEGPETAPVGLCYTSGTTGQRKGVLYSHRSTILQTLTVYGADGLGLRNTSCTLPIAPMCHANAWTLAFSAPMTGSKLVLPGNRLDCVSLWELCDAENVTMAAAVPAVWVELIAEMRRRGRKPGQLERVLTGGSACPTWIMEALEIEFGAAVVHAWGMTEMSPIGTIGLVRPEIDGSDPDARVRQKLKQGPPIYGVEVRITDDDGRELPWDGETSGHLKVRGPAVVSEYFNGAGGAILDRDGYFDTGDRATLDPYGCVTVTDRTKDVIKSGGEWISSIELENHAASHPEILEAAAIAIPHDKWMERPLLLAVRCPDSTVSGEAILEFLSTRVARWWLPDAVLFIDTMPRTATGKISKLALREQYRGFRVPTVP
jgi:fatty-acyl-CoA synthase